MIINFICDILLIHHNYILHTIYKIFGFIIVGIDRDVRVTKTGNKVGLCTHALRHTAITIANTAKNANVVVNALQAGHTAITTENIYTHGRIESQKSIVTPSKAVLDDYKEKPQEEEKELSKEDRELYEMYLKLKEKFE